MFSVPALYRLLIEELTHLRPEWVRRAQGVLGPPVGLILDLTTPAEAADISDLPAPDELRRHLLARCDEVERIIQELDAKHLGGQPHPLETF